MPYIALGIHRLMIELGGNITLVGFTDLEPAKLIVIKKLVGNYARRMSNSVQNFENLTVTLKSIHGEDGKVELHSKLMAGGNHITSEVTDFNLFYALDKSLNKIINSLDA